MIFTIREKHSLLSALKYNTMISANKSMKGQIHMIHILYNPLSNNRKGKKAITKLHAKFNEEITLKDITNMNIVSFLRNVPTSDTIVLAGGDGTLNHFVNDLGEYIPEHEILFYPSGSGNDFIRDLDEPLVNDMVLLNPYIKNLPIININGKQYKFLNGCGYGIDGYACAESERIKTKYKIKVHYALLALMGILFKYKPAEATVVVDDKVYIYDNVWIAPAMKGKYFGGGVMIAPMQKRLNPDNSVTVVLAHCKSPIKLLFVYPSIFKVTHTKYTDIVEFLSGNNISVSFNKPTALQIDGEVINNIYNYTVHS